MIHFIIAIGASALLIDELSVDPVEPIKAGDNLVVYLKYRSQLYISLDKGVLVMNNSFYNENDVDVKLPVSIKRIEARFTDGLDTYYNLIVDHGLICSYGYLFDLTECGLEQGGNEMFTLHGTEDDFTIEGKGGCLTMYDPLEWKENYKHGIRIDSCRGDETQRFMMSRGEV